MAHDATGESANLMWRNLEHVPGAYSEHAKTKRCTQHRGAWGDAHRAAGTHHPIMKQHTHHALADLDPY